MTRCPLAQQLARYLIRRACRRLPDDSRDERYREWTAELPAILSDPHTRYRAARALLYAADHARGVRRYPRPAGKSGTVGKPGQPITAPLDLARTVRVA